MKRLSIVMTLKNRAKLLHRSLAALCFWQTFNTSQVELVLVDDDSEDRDELTELVELFGGFFYRVVLIRMDKKLSRIPVYFNNPALGINIAVKAAENDIIYKTDPECLPLSETVLSALALFDPAAITFFSVRLLNEIETKRFSLNALAAKHPVSICDSELTDLPDLWFISERHRRPYWYGAVFSRELFMKIGGVDEEFLRGFAGEDDDWAERMQRAGADWRWNDSLRILHLYHGAENKRHHLSPAHTANISRLEESRRQARVVANEGYDWGSSEVVTGKSVFDDIVC